jgi:hypothetical protein
MKSVFVTLALLIGSQSAMAMHAYGTDDCTAYTENDKIEISIANSRPANPHIIKIENDTEDVRFVNFIGATMGQDDETDTVLTLKTISSKITGKTTNDEDGWEGWTELSVRVAKVTKASPFIQKEKGLKVGQTLTFICRTGFQAPSGH